MRISKFKLYLNDQGEGIEMNSNGRCTNGYLVGIALMALGLASAGSVIAQDKDDLSNSSKLATATFAGGCFWCMEPPFDVLEGVASTTSGYTGGNKKNPTYKEVSSGVTGHTEAVQIVYDPKIVSFKELLDVFWRNIDPTTADRQFCDRGNQYRPGVFYHDEEQKRVAEASRQEIEERKILTKPNVTEIVAAGPFYPAEDYHQDYYKKNPLRYKFYRTSCGRDRLLKQIWGEAPAH